MSLPLFLIPIVVGLAAQAVKPLLNKQWYAHINHDGRLLPRYGGMPSAHSAFAFSLATVVGMTVGVASVEFAITAVMVTVILDDALRMRIFLGRYGAALRRLVLRLPENEQRAFPYLEERLGHTWGEVLTGAAFGVGLTLLLLLAIVGLP